MHRLAFCLISYTFVLFFLSRCFFTMPRQRDVFPLPGLVEGSRDKSFPLSRSVRRRVDRAVKHLAWKCSTVRTLNRLSGHGLLEPDTSSPLSQGTASAMEHIDTCFSDLGKPPPDVFPEGALRELLNKSGHYSDVRADTTWTRSRGLPKVLWLRRC